MTVDVEVVFAVLGPLLVVLGAVRCLVARRLVPQGTSWLLIGLVFSAVASWLHRQT